MTEKELFTLMMEKMDQININAVEHLDLLDSIEEKLDNIINKDKDKTNN
jgi:hypothetical protein